jgi:hypothetical protein
MQKEATHDGQESAKAVGIDKDAYDMEFWSKRDEEINPQSQFLCGMLSEKNIGDPVSTVETVTIITDGGDDGDVEAGIIGSVVRRRLWPQSHVNFSPIRNQLLLINNQ